MTLSTKDRLTRLEQGQAAIVTSLREVAAILTRLEASLNVIAPPVGTQTSARAPTAMDDAPVAASAEAIAALVDKVWDKFSLTGDAYAFWHNPHSDLGGAIPKDLAKDARYHQAILDVLAAAAST